MAKTRSQTRNITIKKEEEEEDCKSILLLNGVSNTRNNNSIVKRTIPKNRKSRLRAQDIKVEEDTDTKSLLQSSSNYSKLPKGQRVSQEQINQLIEYVVNHGMSVTKASRKVKMAHTTGLDYYYHYKNDPEKKIPLAQYRFMHPKKFHTQEQIKNLIKYINCDKMTIKEASQKAKMSYHSGRKYYYRYLNDPDHAIPIPSSRRNYTQDQQNEFIGYIVNNKMSINAASKKAKISFTAGRKHYHNYFDNQNPDIATPSHIAIRRRYTQEQIKELVSYIVDDKMTIAAASRKANICAETARRYYRRYLKDHNMEIPVLKFRKRYSQEQMNVLMRYIVDDKMSVTAASKKANIAHTTGRRYYLQYLKDNNLDVPIRESITQDKINELIGYIVDDKMTVYSASKKVNVSIYFGQKCYEKYRNDQKR